MALSTMMATRWEMINLACPARFERATYALEEFVDAGISIYFNDLDA
jgi:hypothetical protein